MSGGGVRGPGPGGSARTAPGAGAGAAGGRRVIAPEDLYRSPNALAPDYARFRVAERLLLTGHSHQAWPDRGFDGQRQAWLDAAEHVDDKWERAFARADRVRRGYASLLGDDEGDVALAANTHELVVRLLSALPLRERPRLVTTDGEFHTIRRQLDRLAEEGIEVAKVRRDPVDDLAGRLAAQVDGRTAAVLVSSVLYEDARIVAGLGEIMDACRRDGAELLVDAYHHLNVVPFSVRGLGLEDAFVTGGGYKYCQLGEGNAFLRAPPGCVLRPVITGWFSEFSALERAAGGGAAGERAAGEGVAAERAAGGNAVGYGASPVGYGAGPDRFAGATYDPTSHYRASEVFDFFAERGLTPELLREVSRHQVGLLARAFDALDLDPALIDRDRTVRLEDVAGFLALRTPHAGRLQRMLRERGVLTDHRGDVLRLGPAPYLSDEQLEAAAGALGECVRELAPGT